ncbi:MAG TPA: oligosaccharide flippase family protein [Terracidiphilus sp.]|nr:oligosaccharide flippase family protein [Terracidiphilus sp.]
MRTHVLNSAFGALDYIAYPAGMLLLAPAILNVLGTDRFGIWALANAVLMTGAILASGFGDANIRSVAQARTQRDGEETIVIARSAFGLHLVLGIVIAGCLCLAAPAITHMTLKTNTLLAEDCLWSMRITAGLILLRALEAVCVSTQRAYGRYGTAIEVSVAARIASLLLAWLMPMIGPSVALVLAATFAVNCMALTIQFWQLKRLLGIRHFVPALHPPTVRVLLGFGVFTWIQAAAGLLIGQVDRLASGFALGASAIAVYTICVQLTQPIYGIAAAGLHFLFPAIASDSAHGPTLKVRHSIGVAFTVNFIFVAMSLASLLLFGRFILRHWVGMDMANSAAEILPAAAWSSALSALSVTGCYALLAMGRPKPGAILNVTGGLAMAGALPLLIQRFGLAGVAYSRLLPGCAALLVYIPMIVHLTKQPQIVRDESSLDVQGDLESYHA